MRMKSDSNERDLELMSDQVIRVLKIQIAGLKISYLAHSVIYGPTIGQYRGNGERRTGGRSAPCQKKSLSLLF